MLSCIYTKYKLKHNYSGTARFSMVTVCKYNIYVTKERLNKESRCNGNHKPGPKILFRKCNSRIICNSVDAAIFQA